MKPIYAFLLCVLAMTSCVHTTIGPINTNRTVEIDVTNHMTPPQTLDIYIVDDVGHWHLGEIRGGGSHMKFYYKPTSPSNQYHLWAKAASSLDASVNSISFTLVSVESIDWDIRGDGNDMVRFH